MDSLREAKILFPVWQQSRSTWSLKKGDFSPPHLVSIPFLATEERAPLEAQMIPWVASAEAAELQGFEAPRPLEIQDSSSSCPLSPSCAGSQSGEQFKNSFYLSKALQSQSKNWRGKMTVKYPANPDSLLKTGHSEALRG